MEEGVRLEEALARVLAVDHPVEPAQVVRAVDGPVRGGARDDGAPDPRRAVPGARMGGEPVGQAAAARLARHAVEHAEHLEQLSRLVGLAGHVAQAELVGLVLVVAPELQEQQAQSLLDQAPILLQLRHRDHPDQQPTHRELLLAHLLRGVAAGHVPDLVPDDTRELRLGAEVRQDAARDVDEATGQREGVDGRIVHDLEAPGQPGPLGGGGQPLADPIDVGLDLGVRVQAVGGHDLGVRSAAHRELLGFAHQHQLLLAGGGVRGAGGSAHHRGQGQRRTRAPHGGILARRGHEGPGHSTDPD